MYQKFRMEIFICHLNLLRGGQFKTYFKYNNVLVVC